MWVHLHPLWEHRLWNEQDLRDLNQEKLTALLDNKSPEIDAALISDYARLVILHRFGGVYVDADVRPIRPFDDLMDDSAEVIAGELHPHLGGPKRRIDPNVLFATKESEIIGELVRTCAGLRGGPIGILLEKTHKVKVLPYTFFHDISPGKNAYSSHWSHRLYSWGKHDRK
jgi:hypothetical protein